MSEQHPYAGVAIELGPDAHLGAVAETMSELVRAFVPPDGLRVRVTRGPRTEVLGARFSRTANISAKQLLKGGSVELTAGDFEEPEAGKPLFWITSEPENAIPTRFGCSFVRPTTEKTALAIAHAINTVMEVAVDLPNCVSAVAAGTEEPMSLANSKLRPPGWRVLVPSKRMSGLSRPPPDKITLHRCENGVLIKDDTPDPFSATDIARFERWLLAALGMRF